MIMQIKALYKWTDLVYKSSLISLFKLNFLPLLPLLLLLLHVVFSLLVSIFMVFIISLGVFHVQVKRRTSFYIVVLILPCVLLSCLTLVMFWFPPQRPDRTGLGRYRHLLHSSSLAGTQHKPTAPEQHHSLDYILNPMSLP